jgi:hypothetical protein
MIYHISYQINKHFYINIKFYIKIRSISIHFIIDSKCIILFYTYKTINRINNRKEEILKITYSDNNIR